MAVQERVDLVRGPEVRSVTLDEFGEGVVVVLGPGVLDRVYGGERPEPADDGPGEASGHPLDEPSSVGVAGPGGVDHGLGAGGGDLIFLPFDGDDRPGLPLGDDGDRHALPELALGDPQLLGHHPELVVVAGEDLRPLEPGLQLLGGHPGGLHRGVVEVGDAEPGAFLGGPGHRVGGVGGDQDEVGLAEAQPVQRARRRVLHRPGIKGGDLVVLEVGVDEARRGEVPLDDLDPLGDDPLRLQPGPVLGEVLPDRTDDLGPLPHQGQVVGDIRRRAPPELLHRVDQERHAQDVHLLGEDVVLEMAREDHDVIVSNRSGDDDSHGRVLWGRSIKLAGRGLSGSRPKPRLRRDDSNRRGLLRSSRRCRRATAGRPR